MKKFIPFIIGGVAVVVLVIVVLTVHVNNTGATVDVGGGATVAPSGGNLSDREQACVDAGGTLVDTAVMRVCVP